MKTNPQFMHHNKIQTKILVITLSCILFMCILVSLSNYYLFTNYMQKSLFQSTETSLYLLSDTINGSLNDIYRLSQFCQTNSNIADYLKAGEDPDTLLAISTHERIYEEYSNNPSNSYIPRLAILTPNRFLQIVDTTYSSTTNLSTEVPKLPFYHQLLTADGYDFQTGLINDPFLRSSRQVLPILRPISYAYNAKMAGCMYMEVSSALFIEPLKKYTTAEDSIVYLTLVDTKYVYENGTLTPLEEQELVNLKTVTVPLNMENCSISQTISTAEIMAQRRLFLAVMIGTLICMIATGLIILNTMNTMIHVPVKQLQDKMDQVSLGNFSRDGSIEWDHELGDIGRGINDLAENVESLMQTQLEDEKQKRDLEYKMLQSQINPHFIYNTLNSIKWMATIQGADGISEITTALSRLLKSISKGTKLIIPLQEELSLLNDYFLIQKYRYGGTITMDVRIEEEALYQLDIIKFTLQPLVENSIFHGIEPKGGAGKIDIHGYFADEAKQTVCIDVTDDGIGIPQEKIEKILQGNGDDSSEFFREIGIRNVHKRLQYEFGEEYGISVSSVEGASTTMTIRLPFHKATNE